MVLLSINNSVAHCEVVFVIAVVADSCFLLVGAIGIVN